MDVVKAFLKRRVVVESASFGQVRVALCRHADGSLNFEFFSAAKRAKYDLRSEPAASEDWVEISRPVRDLEVRDDTEESVAAGGDDFVTLEKTDEAGSPLRSWTRSLLREAALRAGEVERGLRQRERRTMLEDAALAALDAAKNAKSSLDESTENAKRWARDKVRDGLHEALALAYERAERTVVNAHASSSWRLEFGSGAAIDVDEFALDLYGPDGQRLCSRTLLFGHRRLRDLDQATAHILDAKPSRVLLKLCFVLAESCVDELVESRPADAVSLAKVVAKQIASHTSNKTKHLIQQKAHAWLNASHDDDDDDDNLDLTPNPASLSDLTIPNTDDTQHFYSTY